MRAPRTELGSRQPTGIVACDAGTGRFVVTSANEVFKSMLGLPLERSVVGMPLFSFVAHALSEPGRREFFAGLEARRQVLVKLSQDSDIWPALRLLLKPFEGDIWAGSLTVVEPEAVLSIEAAVIGRIGQGGSSARADERPRETAAARLVADFDLPICLFELRLGTDGGIEMPFLAGDLAGFDLEAVRSRPEALLERIDVEDGALLRETCRQAARDLSAWRLDCRILDERGRERWLLLTAHPSREADGNVLFTGYTLDVTSRKSAEQELEASQARYRRVVQDQTEVICRFDRDAKLEFVNHACARATGCAAEALIGSSWLDLFEPALKPTIAQHLESLSPQEPFLEEQLRVVCADPRWFQWTVRALFTERAEILGYQAVGRDIQQIRELEQEIREISHREQKRIGHDLHDGLGQELTGISLMLKTLEHDVARCTPELAPRVRTIHAMVGRCIASARALAQGLSPVHLESDGFEVALARLASNVEALYRVPIEIECDSVVILGNDETATDLYRIVQEALTNASKHAKASRILLRLAPSDDGLLVEVEDDGGGLAAGPAAGRGMGLKIMRYRANIIGASLNITTGGDGGTLVQCRLPATALKQRSA